VVTEERLRQQLRQRADAADTGPIDYDLLWDAARRRRRRTTVASVVTAAALVATTAVGVGLGRSDDRSTGPNPAPAPTPAPTPTQEPATDATITDLPDFAALAQTVRTLAIEDPADLSDDPMERAVLAIMPAWSSDADSLTVVDVLGTDGRWRYIDVPGLVPTHDEGGNQGPVLNATSLSADGTRLALPQPGAVVVVDLTTGEYHSYDVPGLYNAVIWVDDTHLVGAVEGREGGKLLDLADGSVSDTSFSANTGFGTNGSWVTWGRSRELVSSDGTRVLADIANGGGLQLTSPLVDDDVAVGLGSHDLKQGLTTYVGVAGVPVIDRHTGDLRAFLYTEPPELSALPTFLLNLNGDTVTLAAGIPPDYGRLLVVRWNWRTGDVTPIEVIKAGMISGTP
jgi:hypothetical protein